MRCSPRCAACSCGGAFFDASLARPNNAAAGSKASTPSLRFRVRQRSARACHLSTTDSPESPTYAAGPLTVRFKTPARAGPAPNRGQCCSDDPRAGADAVQQRLECVAIIEASKTRIGVASVLGQSHGRKRYGQESRAYHGSSRLSIPPFAHCISREFSCSLLPI